MDRESLRKKYYGQYLFHWLQAGLFVAGLLPFAYLWATGWVIPTEASAKQYCREIIMTYVLIIGLFSSGIQILAGPDAGDIRHEWNTGETIVRGYSLREWGLVFSPGIAGFIVGYFVPKDIRIGNLPVGLFVFFACCAIGICAAYWKKLQREARSETRISKIFKEPRDQK